MTDTRIMTLLEGLGAQAVGLPDAIVSGVAYRSDHVTAGGAFFCIPGTTHDGHDYAADAVEHGAAAIVVERALPGISAPQFIVADARMALAHAARTFYGDPSASMAVVGITGTNGKTTSTYLLDSILRADGRVTGIIGTVETRVAGKRLQSIRTTPESSDLQALFAEMRDADVTAVSMEVSSHAVDLGRIQGVTFAVAAFTNLSQDHLDYHGSMEEYFSAKKRFFSDFNVAHRVIAIDDPFGKRLAAEHPDATTVGRAPDALVRATDERADSRGTRFLLTLPGWAAEITLPLAGEFNVSNALTAAGCAFALGIAPETIARGLEEAPQVPGRLERIDAGQPFSVVVDYAHTPDSLEKAIAALRAVTVGRLIVVFGCGGDRDTTKRPLMGKVAAAGADICIVTSDNPRSEDPCKIIGQIESGMGDGNTEHKVEVDRRRAISLAISLAAPADAVLIAGKGHEDYQIFADCTIHFDDREIAREELRRQC